MRRYSLLITSLLITHNTLCAQSFLPDATFGSAGMVYTPEANASSLLYGVAFQADGKIVAAGMAYANDGLMDHHTFLVRYHVNGTVDSSFGVNGRVNTIVGDKDGAYAIEVQPDGKIVVVGNEMIFDAVDSTSVEIVTKPYAIRYNSSGTLDVSFGTNGIHRLGILNQYSRKVMSSLVIRPDGTLVMGGTVFVGQSNQMMALSLNPDGSYNNSFGTGGLALAVPEPGQDAILFDIALQTDGKLVAAGSSGYANLTGPPNTRVALVRFKTDGSLDPAFGTGGKVVTPISTAGLSYDAANSVVLQEDGKIVVAGSTGGHLALLRYHAGGSLDAGFGNGGMVVNGDLPACIGLHINGEGKLLTSGPLMSQEPYRVDILLSRHDENGVLDNSFGTNGTLLIDQSDRDQATTIAVQSDNKVIVAGNIYNSVSESNNFTLFRFTDEDEGGTDISGIEETIDGVKVFPNPATDHLNISFSELPEEKTSVRMVNMLGQVLYQAPLNTALTTIHIKNYASGIYMLQILNGAKQKTFKLEIR
jgi:uncharacterized delta-60 repeat protein